MTPPAELAASGKKGAMRDATSRAPPAPPVGGVAWTPEEAGRFAAVRNFEFVQRMLTLSRRQLSKARRNGLWPKSLQSDIGPAVAEPASPAAAAPVGASVEPVAAPVGASAEPTSDCAPESLHHHEAAATEPLSPPPRNVWRQG